MKKKILAIFLLAAVLLSMLGGCASDRENEGGLSGTVPVDVTPEDDPDAEFGEGELDPENEELIEEEGADVDAGILHAETGRANGIDVSKWQGKIDWQQVNLRAEPDTDSDIIATLSAGEFVSRVGKSGKGWSKLIYNGQTVYAVTSYLTTEAPEATDAPETSAPDPDAGFEAVDEQVTAKESTNLRTAPSTTDSEVVYTLPNGEYVQRVGINPNGWSKLIYNGQTVYAKTSYLTTATYGDDGFEAVDEQVTAKIEVNLRTAPTTEGSEVVYTLKNGEYVHRIGKSADGWSKLEYNGQIVYAKTDYLTTE